MEDFNDGLYVISVAARLTGLHPQTLRQYDRAGLVTPLRLSGHIRLYSQADIERLLRVVQLSRQGLNLVGIERVLALEDQVAFLKNRLETLEANQYSTALVHVAKPARFIRKF